MSSYAFNGAAEAGFGVGDDRQEPVRLAPFGSLDLVARMSAALSRRTSAGALSDG